MFPWVWLSAASFSALVLRLCALEKFVQSAMSAQPRATLVSAYLSTYETHALEVAAAYL